MEDAVKKVRIVGRTNLRPFQIERIAETCDLRLLSTAADLGSRDVASHAHDAEILVVNAFTKIDGTVVRRLPDLRTIISCSSAIDHVDLQMCGTMGVNVRWFPGYCSRTLAEKAVTYMLMAFTRILPAIEDFQAGGWDYFGFQAREIPGRLVAIVGYGATGRIVHDLCRGLGFAVSTVTSATPEPVVRDILREADAVTLHMDLNPRSARFLDRTTLALLKDDVVIVNNARGGLIDEPAMADWLAGHPAATAFLDVVSSEPPAAGHAYRNLPNVVVTPHIGWNSVESDSYLANATFDAVMTAIDSGWTTADGASGAQLLLEHHLDGKQP